MPNNNPLLGYLFTAEATRINRNHELASLPAVPLGSSEPDESEHKYLDAVIHNTALFLTATRFTPTVIASI
jgi:hypothetical protein